jgi:hypothetical protein
MVPITNIFSSILLASGSFAMAPAMSQAGALPDLIEVAGREPLSVPSGVNTCQEAQARYGGTCVYKGGGHPSDFPNGKYGYIHQVELR